MSYNQQVTEIYSLVEDKMKQAVTLMELLIVIAIIGITTAVAAPVLSNYAPGIQLNGSARTLSGHLREAQEKTITEQKQYLIQFHPSDSPPFYELIKNDEGSETVEKTIYLPDNESVSLDAGIADNKIAFSPDGGPSSSGDITLQIDSNTKVINVSPAGFIAIH